jgi:hypothetical protein
MHAETSKHSFLNVFARMDQRLERITALCLAVRRDLQVCQEPRTRYP